MKNPSLAAALGAGICRRPLGIKQRGEIFLFSSGNTVIASFKRHPSASPLTRWGFPNCLVRSTHKRNAKNTVLESRTRTGHWNRSPPSRRIRVNSFRSRQVNWHHEHVSTVEQSTALDTGHFLNGHLPEESNFPLFFKQISYTAQVTAGYERTRTI